jgi:hypothetical protein
LTGDLGFDDAWIAKCLDHSITRSRGRMLSEKQVLEIVPVGRTTLYRMEKAGRFPRSTYNAQEKRIK